MDYIQTKCCKCNNLVFRKLIRLFENKKYCRKCFEDAVYWKNNELKRIERQKYFDENIKCKIHEYANYYDDKCVSCHPELYDDYCDQYNSD